MDKRIVARLHIHCPKKSGIGDEPGFVKHECFSAGEASRVFHTVIANPEVLFVLFDWIDQETGWTERTEMYRRSTGKIENIVTGETAIRAGVLMSGGVE